MLDYEIPTETRLRRSRMTPVSPRSALSVFSSVATTTRATPCSARHRSRCVARIPASTLALRRCGLARAAHPASHRTVPDAVESYLPCPRPLFQRFVPKPPPALRERAESVHRLALKLR